MERRTANPVALGAVLLVSIACAAPTPQPSAAPTDETAPTHSTGPRESTPPSSPAPGSDIDNAYGPPQPVNVSVELSPLTFTSPVTSAHGGFFTLPAPDGTLYQLEIPPDAVLSDLEVTMTVVSSIGGSPLGDTLVGAVKLEPAGLQFNLPATLTITPAVPVSIDEEGPFNANSDGADFHLYPLDPDPSAIRMHLTHFSIFGLFKTDAERRVDMIRRTAADVQAQFEQEMTELVKEARKGDGVLDPAKTEALFNYYRDRVLRPMMALAEKDHTLFRRAIRLWNSWEQRRGLLGYEGSDPELLERARRGFKNYLEHTKERCYEHDFGAIHDILSLVQGDQVSGGLLGGMEESDAFEFIDKCATFTLEMDSTMDVHLNTCMLIDAGPSDVDQTARVTTAVEIRYHQPSPWSGPMQWVSASGTMNCRLPARGGGSIIECAMQFAGFADAGEFAVLRVNFDLNNINRPPPPPPPPNPPTTQPGASPSAAPSGPPPPAPTEAPEETISELRFRSVLVQPGDPQVFYDGDCSVLGFSGGSELRESGSWLPGWQDNTAPVGRVFVNDPEYGEAYLLTNWEFTGDGDELARRTYKGGTSSTLGTSDENTTFILRHTPRR